jgi:hypothetical protein
MNVEKTVVLRISQQPSQMKMMIDQKQPESVEYCKYFGSITNDAKCACEIKSRIAIAKATFNKKKTLFASKLDLNLRKKLIKCCIWSIGLFGAETWTLQKVDWKYLDSFETWCWRKTEKISWTDHVKNEKVLQSVTEEMDVVLCTIKRRKADWIGHILHRHCHLKRDIEGKGEGKGRRQKQLLNESKTTRKYRKLKEEALDCTLWITSFRRGYGHVVKTDYDLDPLPRSGYSTFSLYHCLQDTALYPQTLFCFLVLLLSSNQMEMKMYEA